MLYAFGGVVSFVIVTLTLHMSPTSSFTQKNAVLGQSAKDDAKIVEFTVFHVEYADQSVTTVQAEHVQFQFTTTLYVHSLSVENDRFEELYHETLDSVLEPVDDMVTTGATGVATVSVRSDFESSLLNVVFRSLGWLLLLSSSFAEKLMYVNVLSHAEAREVIHVFLNVAVNQSALQEL